jgi:hypothetical protein
MTAPLQYCLAFPPDSSGETDEKTGRLKRILLVHRQTAEPRAKDLIDCRGLLVQNVDVFFTRPRRGVSNNIQHSLRIIFIDNYNEPDGVNAYMP